jgi:hypothetical protein
MYAMCTPTSTQSVEEKTPELLPEMVPLRSLPHSQRQLFGLSHNCRPELDLLVKNPLKPSKLVTPSPAMTAASTSKGPLMDATKQKAVIDGLADVVHGSSINVNWIYNTEKNAILESMLAMTTPPPNPFCGGHIEKRWRFTKGHGHGLPPTTRGRRTMGWSYREALEVYQGPWPRTAANNKRKKDNGLLNILHKPIEFLADANHRVKMYTGPIFDLGHLPKESENCQKESRDSENYGEK